MRDELTPKRDDLDVLLDAALTTYANPKPSAGLTAQILAATRAIDNHSKVRWIMWALPALAVLLITTLVIHHRPAVLPSPRVAHQSSSDAPASVMQTEKTPAVNPALQPTSPPRSSQPRLAKLDGAASPQPALPKLEVFPSPTSLSPEEQALAAAVNRNPEKVSGQVAQSAAPSPEQPIEPLRIAAIHIPPLNPPDNGAN